MMNLTIKEMTIADYDPVLALWQLAEGVGLSDADSPDGIAAFLERNPGLSFVAMNEEKVVGVILCGHDGRRGYIHHLAVSPSHRRQGIGQALVAHSLAGLEQAGIAKCHLFVFRENKGALTFWQNTGWIERVDLGMWSRYTQDSKRW
jgi:ribosomal protein S18 acetylase RimI-like enzyme